MGEEKEGHGELFVSTRGAFIRRMVAAGFTVPLVGSFGFAELASAGTGSYQHHPNQTQHHRHDDSGDGPFKREDRDCEDDNRYGSRADSGDGPFKHDQDCEDDDGFNVRGGYGQF